MRNLWASFDFLVHFLIIFFIVQSFKNEIWSKILDIQKYNFVRHWFSSKNWIFAIFFKKVSIDGFTHYLWKILLIFIVQSFKNEISSKILDTQKYNIVRHWFSSKNWIFSIFFKKVSIDGFTHYFIENIFFYCPKFQKWNFIKNPWYTKIQHCTTWFTSIIIYLWFFRKFLRNFMTRSNNTHYSDKNWNLWASFDFLVHFLIIFFIVQSFKNEISSKILDTQKYNIVRHWFSSKNWIFAIFFKKVSIDGFTHYLWKILLIFIVQSFKNEISSKILDTQKYNIVRHWFSSKNWIFSIFFKKVSIDGFTHFSSKIHPKFSKNRLFHIPQYIIYLWSEFYARSNNQTIRIFG